MATCPEQRESAYLCLTARSRATPAPPLGACREAHFSEGLEGYPLKPEPRCFRPAAARATRTAPKPKKRPTSTPPQPKGRPHERPRERLRALHNVMEPNEPNSLPNSRLAGS